MYMSWTWTLTHVIDSNSLFRFVSIAFHNPPPDYSHALSLSLSLSLPFLPYLISSPSLRSFSFCLGYRSNVLRVLRMFGS